MAFLGRCGSMGISRVRFVLNRCNFSIHGSRKTCKKSNCIDVGQTKILPFVQRSYSVQTKCALIPNKWNNKIIFRKMDNNYGLSDQITRSFSMTIRRVSHQCQPQAPKSDSEKPEVISKASKVPKAFGQAIIGTVVFGMFLALAATCWTCAVISAVFVVIFVVGLG
ncbi:MAG: hypothetical protein Harvfovirus78_2 [Harvfovirus sp.]|uniref:Transmembrane protein n=1 Tax=Harvfovirus sp. TaxID=2487768 RepID=A0A3G5A3W5_9VIRU|nr:MAG: hypothetical protein Harvfovirus78_2 [Harvfovirus sp.]